MTMGARFLVGFLLTALSCLLAPAALALGALPLNGSSSGALDGSHTSDTWSITIPQDGSLTVTVVSDAALELDVRMYDADGTTQVAADTGWGPSSSMTFDHFRPGTYFIKPYRYSGAGNYTIANSFTPAALANDPEPNDASSQAVAMGPNATGTGHIGYYGSGYTDITDWYAVTLPQDGSLRIQVTVQSTAEVIDMELYSSDASTEIARSHTWEPTEVITVPNLAPGTYYLRLFRYGAFGPYTVTTALTPQPLGNDTEPNDTAQAAQSASLFAPQRGHLGYGNGLTLDLTDWFRFRLPADGNLWVDVLTDDSMEADMELYKADGTTVVSSDHGWGPRSRIGADELLAGDYLLRIFRYSGYGGYTATPSADLLFVNLLGPTTVVPGESIVYSVRYGNPTDAALDDVVVRVELPYALAHAGTTGGGIFCADACCGNQVFWKLGTLPAGGNGQVTFTLAVPWGTPNADTWARAQLGARNFPGGSPFDVQPYLAYAPEDPLSEWTLSSGQVTAELAGDAGLRTLYDQLLAAGYKFFGTAMGWVLPDGTRLVRLYLMRSSDGVQAILTSDGQRAFAEVFDGNAYTLLDTGGGSTWDRDLGTWTPWGTWANPSRGEGSPEGFTGLREAQCQINCTVNAIPEVAVDIVLDRISELSFCKDCIKCAASMKAGEPDAEACAVCTAEAAKNSSTRLAKKIPVLGTAVSWAMKVAQCVKDCVADPSKHICTQDKRDCGCWDPLGWLGGFESRCQTRCNRVTGTYAPVTERIQCAYGQKCLDGECVPESQVCSGKACKSKTVKVRPSHDPNAKHVDFLGEVLPGQRLSYTLEYENAGSGTAYGVFILDTLDANLDEATLLIDDGGTFSPASRMVDFEIGDVPPGGKGSVSFSVAVKASAPNGTEVVNQADIYFPNALEVTPTNGVVNRVATLVADPKELGAVAGTPLPITLSGRSAAGGALTYRILTPPLFGSLAGTPPSVTYTADPQNVGPDAFTYAVSDGTGESSPAQVTLLVGPDPDDHTPPQVLSTFPGDGATGVLPGNEPVGTNPPQYTPSISASFSEPLDPASVNGNSMAVGGLTGTVAYDAARRALVFVPGVALAGQRSYTARVVAGLRDMAGNATAAEHSWTFTTGGGAPGDCDGNGTVSIGEVQKAINMFLGTQPPGCGVDCSGDGVVSIGEVQKVINGFLGNATSC